jgi:hypothetical protein
LIRTWAALATCLLLAGCQTTGSEPDPYGFTKTDLLHGFDKSAYGWEFSERDRDHIIRYEKSLKILLIRESGDERASASLDRVLAFIRGLYRGPDIDSVRVVDLPDFSQTDVDASNLLVFAVGPSAYESVHAKLTKDHVKQGKADVADLFYFNRCAGFIFSKNSRIVRSIVMMDVKQNVNRDGRRELDECFAEETLQGLGLPNDHDSLKWSMFNDNNNIFWPGEFDRILLSMLYSDELAPGMPKNEVADRLPGIINQLWPEVLANRARQAGGGTG